jgi:hypothetical protein
MFGPPWQVVGRQELMNDESLFMSVALMPIACLLLEAYDYIKYLARSILTGNQGFSTGQ